MKMNTTSLIVGWFGALTLMWVVVSMNNTPATLAAVTTTSASEGNPQASLEHSQKPESMQQQILKGF